MKRIVAASLAVAALAAGAGTATAAEPGEYRLYYERYGARNYEYGYYRPYAYRTHGYAPAYGYYGYGPSVGVSIGFGPAYGSYYW